MGGDAPRAGSGGPRKLRPTFTRQLSPGSGRKCSAVACAICLIAPPTPRAQNDAKTLEMRLEHAALAHQREVSSPRARADRHRAAVEKRLHRRVRRPPQLCEAPGACKPSKLVVFDSLRDGGDVHDVEKPPQRDVRPGMGCEDERVVRRPQRLDAVDTGRAGHGGRQELLDRGARRPSTQFGRSVDLDHERHLRPDDRPQVMDVAIELLVPGQLEAGREESALHRRCIRHEKIEVPEGA